MSTRATINICDGQENYFVYRHCDGFPDIIEPDILAAIERNKLLSGSNPGHLVSVLLGMTFRPKERVQNYEMTTAFHGDESYKYFVKWNDKDQSWHLEPQAGGRQR